MKIAILILAHKNENQLLRLVNHLAKDFDVYVHLDKKSVIKIENIRGNVIYKNIYLYQKYYVSRGSYTQILATILLYRKSQENVYDRYILISGQDVPIKTNKEIIDFFSKNNNCEFIEYAKLPWKCWDDGGLYRLNRFHPISWVPSPFFDRLFVKLNNTFVKYINIITINKPIRRLNYNFYGGANWSSLTNICVKNILKYIENNKRYSNRYKHTICADEIFFHTIILNTKHENNIVSSTLRYIDWGTGPEYPRTFKIEDYENIMNSPALFARKFDDCVDNDIIERIYKELVSSSEENIMIPAVSI